MKHVADTPDVPLGNLVPVALYQQQRAHIFPSLESLRWFLRRNRSSLIKAGAIIAPARSILVNCKVFDRAVQKIGKERIAGHEART